MSLRALHTAFQLAHNLLGNLCAEARDPQIGWPVGQLFTIHLHIHFIWWKVETIAGKAHTHVLIYVYIYYIDRVYGRLYIIVY